jgi:UDP-N-acetylmuramate dehydrogenase
MGVSIDGQKATVGAAVMMNDLVTQLNQAGLAGMEWAGGLPGTFGGAVRGNAGCFGGEMKDSILSVESVNKNTGEITKRNNKECEFIYRGSYFKSHQDEIIVSAELELTTASPVDLEKISDDHRMFRKARHPQKPSAGSVFKNTPVEKVPAQFMADFKNFVKTDPFPIVPTGKIIADTGLVGASVGDAQVSSQHANMIINNNHATGEDIFELIQKIKLAVREKYGIELEVEPELVGF